jgi:hypothetical protein
MQEEPKERTGLYGKKVVQKEKERRSVHPEAVQRW